MQLSLTTQTVKVAQGNHVLHRREAVGLQQKVCMFYITFMYVCTYLASTVGRAVLGGRQVAEGLKGGMLLEALNTTVCVHLDLLVTGVCSQERAASWVRVCVHLDLLVTGVCSQERAASWVRVCVHLDLVVTGVSSQERAASWVRVCVHLDLLVTGVCSQERSASCVSSCAQLQWVTWREVDTEVSGGTYCTLSLS